MTYGKMVLKQVKTTTWGSVYYTNIISLLPMFVFGSIVAGEWGKYKKRTAQVKKCKKGYDFDHRLGKCIKASKNRAGGKGGTKNEKTRRRYGY